MEFKVDWQFLLLASFGVTGIIQWVKGIVKDPKNPWSYVAPVLCAGMGILMNGGFKDVIMNSVLILSVSQLGYDVLVKPVKKLLGVAEEPVTTSPVIKIAPIDPAVKQFLKDSDSNIGTGPSITSP